MELPNFITDSQFAFDVPLSKEKDYRDLCPNISEIESWKNFPDKKYRIVGEVELMAKGNKKEDFNSIVRYILFLYDKKSPFHKKFNSIETKKANAILYSGIKEELIEHDEVIDMIVSFLVYQNSKLWSVIMTNERLFIEYLTILNTKLENFNSDKDIVETLTKKEKVRGFLETLCNDLDSQYERLYGGDKELMENTQKKVRLSPETVSKKLLSI